MIFIDDKMTFLELHNKITQSRKARRGVHNRHDYLSDDPNEAFLLAVYKRALNVATQTIRHYIEKGEFDIKDRPKITWKE